MSNNVIFYTQVIMIVAFIMALFGIYRSLVSQKDGVIELLREQLKKQESEISTLQKQSPDILVKTLSERIEIAVNEIKRLKLDDKKRKEKIEEKTNELKKSTEQQSALLEEKKKELKKSSDELSALIEKKELELNKSREQLSALAELITEADLVCPHCNSPLIQRGFYPIYGYHNGREVEAEGEYSQYECGLEVRDGKEESPCNT